MKHDLPLSFLLGRSGAGCVKHGRHWRRKERSGDSNAAPAVAGVGAGVEAQVRCTRPEKVMLIALAERLNEKRKLISDALRSCVMLVKPETILKWHRELVRRKWIFKQAQRGGRPRIDIELEALIVRLAKENGRMGYGKIQGELLKLVVSDFRTQALLTENYWILSAFNQHEN